MKNHIQEILDNSVELKTSGFVHPAQMIAEIFHKMNELELVYGIKMSVSFPEDPELDAAMKEDPNASKARAKED